MISLSFLLLMEPGKKAPFYPIVVAHLTYLFLMIATLLTIVSGIQYMVAAWPSIRDADTDSALDT